MPNTTITRIATVGAMALAALAGFAGQAAAEPLHRAPVAARSVVWPLPSPRLDQGGRGVCWAEAIGHAVNVLHPGAVTQRVAEGLIAADPHLAPGPGEDSDTARAGWLTRQGIPVTAVTLHGADAVLAAVSRGPVVIGVPLHAGMLSTASSGRWLPSGPVLPAPDQRHAVLVRGVDWRAGRVLLVNSWGIWWGVGGTMWLTLADFRALMRAGGTATLWLRRDVQR